MGVIQVNNYSKHVIYQYNMLVMRSSSAVSNLWAAHAVRSLLAERRPVGAGERRDAPAG